MKIRVRQPRRAPGPTIKGDAPESEPESALAPAADTAAEVIERVRLVSSSLRQFGVEPELALRVCGVGPQLLEELLDLGLPSKTIDGQRTYDGIDLANVAVHLGLPSLQCQAMVKWGRTLEAVSRRPSARYELEYGTRCAQCAPKTAGSYVFLVPPGRRAMTRGGRPHRLSLERPTEWPALPAAAEAMSEYLSEFWFWGLPDPLREDMGFIRENRLAGCGSAARIVRDESRRIGLEAQMWFGLMLVVPFSGGHFWNDVLVDDVWVPFDPFLMQILVRHVGMDAREWPATRSPGAILAPMGTDRARELATHNGHATPSTIMTRIQAA